MTDKDFPYCPVCDPTCPYLTKDDKCCMKGGPWGECDDFDFYNDSEEEKYEYE